MLKVMASKGDKIHLQIPGQEDIHLEIGFHSTSRCQVNITCADAVKIVRDPLPENENRERPRDNRGNR